MRYNVQSHMPCWYAQVMTTYIERLLGAFCGLTVYHAPAAHHMRWMLPCAPSNFPSSAGHLLLGVQRLRSKRSGAEAGSYIHEAQRWYLRC